MQRTYTPAWCMRASLMSIVGAVQFFWKLMFWKKREENYGARKVYTAIRATGAKAKALCREHSMTQHLEHGNLARPSRLRYGDDWARMDLPPSDLTKRSCSLRDSLR